MINNSDTRAYLFFSVVQRNNFRQYFSRYYKKTVIYVILLILSGYDFCDDNDKIHNYKSKELLQLLYCKKQYIFLKLLTIQIIVH